MSETVSFHIDAHKRKEHHALVGVPKRGEGGSGFPCKRHPERTNTRAFNVYKFGLWVGVIYLCGDCALRYAKR